MAEVKKLLIKMHRIIPYVGLFVGISFGVVGLYSAYTSDQAAQKLQESLDSAVKERDRLRDQLNEMRTLLDSAIMERDRLNDQLNIVNGQLNIAVRERNELRTQLESIKILLANTNVRTEDIQKQLLYAQSFVYATRDFIDAISERDDLRTEIDEMKKDFEFVKTKVTEEVTNINFFEVKQYMEQKASIKRRENNSAGKIFPIEALQIIDK